ncbi:MAG: pilus assembly PilX N-terminal domain-containing protein [Nitrospinae bacterium]|nr:pilus assembly PilX N-terminal domain-containing protein [Nitrospinota bacterium]
MDMLRNEKGFVLIVALIFLILLTAIGTASIFNATTEIKIAGNTKTASASLYIAESGMEAVKALLNKSAIDYFSIDGGSNKSITGDYIYNNPTAALNKTLMYPLYWVVQGNDAAETHSCVQTDGKPYPYTDNLWRFANSIGSCTDTILSDTNIATRMINNTSLWPIYKDFTVGTETARVFIDTPQWSPSAPTKVIIPSQSQHINSNPMKKVSANMEIEFGNSLLVFQSFRNGTAAVDNSLASNIVIGNPTGDSTIDYGIGGTNNTDRITGIYTGSAKVRIRKSTDGGVTWSDYALPRITGQTATATWLLNSTYAINSIIIKNGRIYKVTTAGISGAAEPAWPTAVPTVNDGTVVWQEAGGIWVSNSAYAIYSIITRNSHLYKVVTAGTSGGTEPTWTTTPAGVTVNDGTVVWQEAGDMYPVNSTFIIGRETTNPTWVTGITYKTTNSEPYTATNRIPITKNGHIYKIAAGGTSGATEPAWPTTVGAIVIDGTVVWQECGCMYAVADLPVTLTAGHRFKVDEVSLDTNCP